MKFYILHIVIILLLFIVSSGTVLAQSKTNQINDFVSQMRVNTDSTVSVRERITFHFRGKFHNVTRDISLQKLSKVTDVQVLDENLQPVAFEERHGIDSDRVTTHFNKNDFYGTNPDGTPQEWDKTFYFMYNMHGAISFLKKNKDGLYANAFTDWSVPIQHAVFKISVPTTATMTSQVYIDPNISTIKTVSTNATSTTVTTVTQAPLPPHGKLSMAVTWPSGIVNKSAFWKGALLDNIVWLITSFSLLASIAYALITWFRNVYSPEHSQTIVAEYKPPLGMSPEEMFFLLKKRINVKKVMPAMIISMANRGILRIEDDTPRGFWEKLKRNLSVRGWGDSLFFFIRTLTFFISSTVLTGFVVWNILTQDFHVFLITLGVDIFLLFLLLYPIWNLFKKDYVLHIDPQKFNSSTTSPENEIIGFLMTIGKVDEVTFSTYEARKKLYQSRKVSDRARQMSSFTATTKTINDQVSLALTKYYDITSHTISKKISRGKNASKLSRILNNQYVHMSGGLAASYALFYAINNEVHRTVAIQGFFFFASYVIYMIATNNPRFNETGNDLYRKVLGFKLYLKTAERYRLQNLTPDTFEEFLPYAMILGIEKEWAQSFQNLGISLNNPIWFSTHSQVSTIGTNSNTSLSMGGFADSFSSSVTSSFFPSNGAFGGGGAGGGAGGGGGSAS